MQQRNDPKALQKLIGERLKQIRLEEYDQASRTAFTQIIAEAEGQVGSRPQITETQLKILENGQGSAKIIYEVMAFLCASNVNLNYLFDDREPMHRSTEEASVFADNITDYLAEVQRRTRESRAALGELEEMARKLDGYIANVTGRNDDSAGVPPLPLAFE